MNKDINLDEIHQDLLQLRESVQSVQIATIDSNDLPDISYAPFIWHQNFYYLFLSELAAHTKNLKKNSAISILIIESEEQVKNPFARKRFALKGEVNLIARSDQVFKEVMDQFRNRFGGFIDVIEPLQDFQLFQIVTHGGRFIRGFAQAFELTGKDLNQLVHINPAARTEDK